LALLSFPLIGELQMTDEERTESIGPESPLFLDLIEKIQEFTASKLDGQVRLGVHEPGHGAAHMEMTLYFFLRASRLLKIPKDKVLVGALATILHDVWRENVYDSHTVKSAKAADAIMRTRFRIGGKHYIISDWVRELALEMISSHSIHSARAKTMKVPDDWMIVAMTLQSADILASGGAFGYLRSFSYSGHVLKSMLDRIKIVVRDPKKFSDPLPENLRLFLSASQNAFHEWILSIMLRTDRKTIEHTDFEKFKNFALSMTRFGADRDVLIQAGGFVDRETNHRSESSLSSIDEENRKLVFNALAIAEENKKVSSDFNDLIRELDLFAARGLIDNSRVDSDIENDILILLEYSVPGICSRAFWGQFNPVDVESDEDTLTGYLTLPERIESFRKLLEKIGGSAEKAGIKTEHGKKLFKKTYSKSSVLVESALKQYREQRWTLEMWDSF